MIYRRKSFFEYLREITVIEWIGGVFVVLLPYIVIWVYYFFTGQSVQF